ncbi:hypothetical protein GII36_01685 [Candidatus Mycosynbacter amalyticus]|uniref:Uncharacterized protein n=1 Tax=Candidatus Mycosynbacter amalyticus TaxID=2665156 RepID=A0A857MMQ2_9BACT|nr:exodeoxyribonuclease VII small subunit [Candidatus Mycosynbacter amalyticus]QHN42559.1 hypothetical protein GII36_01685 [Candidatus Mycosynbacter amalyticus]
MTKNNDTTIEQKIEQLEQAVAWFDSDEFVLEQATSCYEQAQKLADEIQRDIAGLKNTIEQVSDSGK